MKRITTLLCALLLVAMSFAQNGINYKAIVKDDAGNIIANDLIVVQFEIRQGTETGTVVYKENHTPTTDTNGIIVVNIGEGTPITNTFGAIPWASDAHFLKVEVNTGSGLVDMGTTEFKAVPYALNALNANNVSGLEKLTEDGKTGWRLIGRDPAEYDNIGQDAIDFSLQDLTVGGATGPSAFAAGSRTFASGSHSVAFGFENSATNFSSFVGGFDSTSSGLHSFAYGSDAIASGENAVAFGYESRATNYTSFAAGDTVISGGNGSAAFGSFSWAEGNASLASGSGTNANGIGSFTSGLNSIANGDYATAMGSNTIVTANAATAVGEYNFDNTIAAFMVGNGASGAPNNAFTVEKSGDVGIGINSPFNPLSVLQSTGTANTVRIESEEHPSGKDLLELIVPAGTTSGSQFIEMQNGATIVAVVNSDGSARFTELGIDGVATGKLHIFQNSQTVGTGLRFDDGTANSDWDITHGFALRFHYGGALRGFINANTGAYTQSSDIRLKSNVEALPSVINKIEKLRPTTYIYNTDESNKQAIGLIAQEVQKIFPEVVHYSEADDLYGIDYAAFSVVAIKAIQEQQVVIKSMEERLLALEDKIKD